MKNNIIIRGVGGFYDVLTKDNQEIRCKLRGKLRLSYDKVLVGDMVELTTNNDGSTVIETILPRKNSLVRPPIANIDQAVIVLALTDPSPDLLLLDRLLVLVGAADVEPILCINKIDLAGYDQLDALIRPYQNGRYQVVTTSAKKLDSVKDLKEKLIGKVSTFAGPSGVGKSSLLNRIETSLNLAVGTISAKSKRGKHTTRSVELIRLSDGGLVADTPGFSQLALPRMEQEKLQLFFPEFLEVTNECRFRGCLHHKEPSCAVRSQVQAGNIILSRYNNYLTLLEELKQVNEYR